MVERPIKKSERLAQTPSNDISEGPNAQPIGASNVTRPERSKRDKDKGKGRKGSRDSEPRAAVNPALMRGPKPVRPQPAAVEELPPAIEPDSSAEENLDSSSAEQPEA